MKEVKYVTLEGNLIRLEPLASKHLSDLEKDFEPELFTYYPKPYFTAEEFVEENFQTQKRGNFLPYAIIEKSTGKAIGCTEFSAIDVKNKKLEIGGSWLKSVFHGSAMNSEAKFLLLTYAFEKLNFVRVQFTANALNRQSRTGIEKIGAKFEGILRNSIVLPDGTLRDDAYYSIIASEWPQSKEALLRRIQSKMLNPLWNAASQ